MKPSEHMLPHYRSDERIEAYLNGDLSPEDTWTVETRLARDPGNRDLLLARRIRDGLRAMPQPMCPPFVELAIMQRVHADVQRTRRSALQTWFNRWWGTYLQPALAMAVLLAVVTSAALLGRSSGEPETPQAEVEQALAEAKWALAFVSKVGRETGEAVRDDVLTPHVVRPVRQAVGVALHEPASVQP